MKRIKESMMLWLPAYMVEDREVVTDVTKANGLVMDFFDGDICLTQVIDEFNDIGVDLDSYLDVLDKVTS